MDTLAKARWALSEEELLAEINIPRKKLLLALRYLIRSEKLLEGEVHRPEGTLRCYYPKERPEMLTRRQNYRHSVPTLQYQLKGVDPELLKLLEQACRFHDAPGCRLVAMLGTDQRDASFSEGNQEVIQA